MTEQLEAEERLNKSFLFPIPAYEKQGLMSEDQFLFGPWLPHRSEWQEWGWKPRSSSVPGPDGD
jgi:hypothetical protein